MNTHIHIERFQQLLNKQLAITLASIIAAGTLSGCESPQVKSDETAKIPAPTYITLGKERSFIPIIYPDKVVELNPRTGQERTIPDEDLIVERGKVWGRLLRLGNDVEYTLIYQNNLCAPTLTTDIESIGESSRPVRSFAIPEQKFDNCEDEQMNKAVKRIKSHQGE